jgi:hypothetical protein
MSGCDCVVKDVNHVYSDQTAPNGPSGLSAHNRFIISIVGSGQMGASRTAGGCGGEQRLKKVVTPQRINPQFVGVEGGPGHGATGCLLDVLHSTVGRHSNWQRLQSIDETVKRFQSHRFEKSANVAHARLNRQRWCGVDYITPHWGEDDSDSWRVPRVGKVPTIDRYSGIPMYRLKRGRISK